MFSSRREDNVLKRKRTDDDTIDAEFYAYQEERKRRRLYRPIVKQLQLLHERWRNTDDEWERGAIEADIQDLQDELDIMDVKLNPQLEHLMSTPIVSGQARASSSERQIAFGPEPAIAFFPVEKRMRRSPRQRLASEGELEKHRKEMSSAMKTALEKGFSYIFG